MARLENGVWVQEHAGESIAFASSQALAYSSVIRFFEEEAEKKRRRRRGAYPLLPSELESLVDRIINSLPLRK